MLQRASSLRQTWLTVSPCSPSLPPAHSLHGTGAELKLPNFSEDANWQGLAQLYSVNESLFEHRHDYSPSLEDWANFAKDVDSMFALLSNLKKLNRTEKLEPWADLGSGSGAGGLEEASGAGAAEQVEWRMVLTSGPLKLTPMTHLTPPQRTRQSANELPEGLPTKPSKRQENLQPQNLQNELDQDDLSFSGNGLTELETRHNFLFSGSALEAARDLSRTRGEKGGHLAEKEDEEDIFEAQIYLPARLPSQGEETAPSQRPLRNLQTLHAHGPHDSLDSEGSGLPVSPSSTLL